MSVADAKKKSPGTLLFVDDEQSVLNSLSRLFRPHGYQVLSALSGKEGLEHLEKHDIDVVISDMRMPNMNGSEFLKKIAERSPNIMRILLTGFADINDAIDAINNGKIFNYIAKPWENEQLKLTVERAIQSKNLETERQQLLQLTKKQNEELSFLNKNLEQKVEERTKELKKTVGLLETANANLQKTYDSTISIFANLIALRDKNEQKYSRNLAKRARNLAIACGFDKNQVQDIYYAGLLQGLGKMVLPETLILKAYNNLSAPERKKFHQYPIIGEMALTALEHMNGTAKIIRSHKELLDGTGFPDGLQQQDIPIEAQLLCVVSTYYALVSGQMFYKLYSEEEATQYLIKHQQIKFNKSMVDKFSILLRSTDTQLTKDQIQTIAPKDAIEGMTLVKDLLSEAGMILLTKNSVLTEDNINKLLALEKKFKTKLTLHVRK